MDIGLPSSGNDAPREACGIVGAYLPGSVGVEAAEVAFFGIFALQHRGQESAGIAVGDGRALRSYTNVGLVSQVFRQEDIDRLPGHVAIGHTRYSTTGSSSPLNAQPILSASPTIEIALAHNGNVINAVAQRDKLLEETGAAFKTTTDSEVIAHLLAWSPEQTWEGRAAHLHRRLEGAYSLVIATKDALVAMRDPHGVRPLCLGRYGAGWVVASESAALDHVGAQFLREIDAGETVVIDRSGLRSIPCSVPDARRAHCVFEPIYFARPDSVLEGRLAHGSRERMGQMLARRYPVEADIVIPVPDSGTPAAVGYAKESGIPLEFGLIKNRYVGRTFIEPTQHFRELGVRNKFNPLPEMLTGKRVVLVDDSIVRGTTTPRVIGLLRSGGAREVHLRVCAPPIRHPCHFGVDMATESEFVASGRTVDEVRDTVGADSLAYLTVEQLHEAVSGDSSGAGYCDACFTGRYPIPVQLQLDKFALERPIAQAD
ncbi:MAG: amidophosphoribosyltransferase [Chloroflexota bacterium]|nr:amidophosphoribosyltransferase [Chloroflexota bacterium]